MFLTAREHDCLCNFHSDGAGKDLLLEMKAKSILNRNIYIHTETSLLPRTTCDGLCNFHSDGADRDLPLEMKSKSILNHNTHNTRLP